MRIDCYNLYALILGNCSTLVEWSLIIDFKRHLFLRTGNTTILPFLCSHMLIWQYLKCCITHTPHTWYLQGNVADGNIMQHFWHCMPNINYKLDDIFWYCCNIAVQRRYLDIYRRNYLYKWKQVFDIKIFDVFCLLCLIQCFVLMITVLYRPFCNVVLKLHILDSSLIDSNLEGQVGVPHTIQRTEINRRSLFLQLFKS